MKKNLLILLLAVCTVQTAFAGYFNDKGAVSGWSFTPLQVDASLLGNQRLFDESSDTFISLGVFLLQQKSAVFSCALIANTLQNNYGIQLTPLFMGVATDNNYGISFGWDNYCKKCYGLQIGILNHSWGGGAVEKERELLQVCGVNIADTVYVGAVNVTNKYQVGLINLSGGAVFQLGLLNYNPRSYIPWMPLINFDMGRTPERIQSE